MDYNKMTDEQLVSSYRGGDKVIMNFLMEKYKGMVRQKAKAMYLLGGENDDLIQEGMIGLFKAVQDYNPNAGASFYSFAEMCVSRQIYSAIKAAGRKKHSPLNSYISLYTEGSEGQDGGSSIPLADTIEAGAESNPEELFLKKEYAEAFEEKLKERLSKMENTVLYLHLLGMDYLTIANIMGKSPKAIDNALQRIRAKAREIFC